MSLVFFGEIEYSYILETIRILIMKRQLSETRPLPPANREAMAMTIRDFFYILTGYLLGSILFAPLCAALLGKGSVTEASPDQNPGTANAFAYGGFWCGAMTLAGDLAKGLLPVYCFLRQPPESSLSLALVIAAPVIGHIFPVYHGFSGGKGIATTFGCLLGLLPLWRPVAALIGTFLFFSVIMEITPNYYRTIVSFVCAMILMPLIHAGAGVVLGFGIITLVVLTRLRFSSEEKEDLKVRTLWTH